MWLRKHIRNSKCSINYWKIQKNVQRKKNLRKFISIMKNQQIHWILKQNKLPPYSLNRLINNFSVLLSWHLQYEWFFHILLHREVLEFRLNKNFVWECTNKASLSFFLRINSPVFIGWVAMSVGNCADTLWKTLVFSRRYVSHSLIPTQPFFLFIYFLRS